MKRTILFIILLLASLGAVFYLLKPISVKSGPVLADIEKEIGIHFPGSEKYQIKKNLQRKGRENLIQSIEAASGNKLLRIEILTGLSIEDSQRTTSMRLNMIQSLYSNLPSPYPGAITNQIKVPDELQPQVHILLTEEGERTLYILGSNSRYTYGAMTDEMVAYRGGLAFIYNETAKTLFRIDLFVPKIEFNKEEVADFFENIQLISSSAGGKKTPHKTDVSSKTTGLKKENKEGNSDITNTLHKPDYNLIIIAFEPLGADHVSSYGYKKKTTPNLDRFAEESFLFENASSPSSWSLPVFMSWFTSLYPSQHRVINKYSKYTDTEQVLANLADLSPEAVTLTQVLKEKGYSTAAFTGGSSLAGNFGFKTGFDQYFDEKDFGGFDLTMPKAIKWLSKYQREKFFLFVQGYDVHGKFPLERSYLDRFLDPPYTGISGSTEDEYWALRNKNLEEGGLSLPVEDIRLWKAVYDAKIFAADQRFGEFIDKLRQMDVLDRSIVIVSSGSGNEYLQHSGIDHGYSLYEELLHVPLLIRLPKANGKKINELVRTLDLMPTIIDLLDIQPENAIREQIEGKSLLPLMVGEPVELDAVAHTDYLNRVFKRSIRTHDGWKLIVSLDSEKRELYNLNDDPAEQKDIVSKHPRKAYELEQKMFKMLKSR